MRVQNYINGIEGVTPGGVCVSNNPLNRRYHGAKIFATANTTGGSPTAITDVTQIVDSVRQIVNGVVIRDTTAAELLAIAKLNGQTVGNNELPIWYSEPWRASVLGEEATSWDMFFQTKFTYEIRLKSTITSPAVKILASYDFARNVSVENGKQVYFLSIIKQLPFTYNAPAGQYDITSLPIRFPIQRIHLQASTGTISPVEVTRDGEKVLEGTSAELARFLADYSLDSTAFTQSLVFDAEQQISSALLVSRELLVRLTSSAANTLRALVEHRANGYV